MSRAPSAENSAASMQPSTSNDAAGGQGGRELRRTVLSRALVNAYKVAGLRRLCIRLALQLEGEVHPAGGRHGRGGFWSSTIREILREYHGVEVGAYSYGLCLQPGAIPAGVIVGRYASIGSVRIHRRDHRIDLLSLHPFFYNPIFGLVPEDGLETVPLRIGHDAWIGDDAIIVSGCKSIGIGAVVGAGSVVTHDVPDFAVVGGAPAKVLKMRFNPEVRAAILESRWWERTIEELAGQVEAFTTPLESPIDVIPFTSR
jgi:virginiamycin A acetyltransferase